jgi:hypothetical protein
MLASGGLPCGHSWQSVMPSSNYSHVAYITAEVPQNDNKKSKEQE